MPNDFDINFRYEGKEYHLVEGEKSGSTIQINGVTYSVLGEDKEIEKVANLLQILSDQSHLSIEDLKAKLTSTPDLSETTLQKGLDVGSAVLKTGSKDDSVILPEKRNRPRTHSLPPENILNTKLSPKEELAQKSGHIWECVDSIPDKFSNGRINIFKIRDEYDTTKYKGAEKNKRAFAFQNKTYEIFPAVEPDVEDLFIFNDPSSEMSKIYNALGYGFNIGPKGAFLSLPDRDALMTRWELLRKEIPQLPPFSVVSSEGIADDLTFIESFFMYDSLLSNGKETVHDHIIHIIPTISTLLLSIKHSDKLPPYDQNLLMLRREVASAYKELMTAKMAVNEMSFNKDEKEQFTKRIERVQAFLGSTIDGITATRPIQRLQIEKGSIYKGLNASWEKYMKNRFGDSTVDDARKELANSWREIRAINAQVKKLRQNEKT